MAQHLFDTMVYSKTDAAQTFSQWPFVCNAIPPDKPGRNVHPVGMCVGLYRNPILREAVFESSATCSIDPFKVSEIFTPFALHVLKWRPPATAVY